MSVEIVGIGQSGIGQIGNDVRPLDLLADSVDRALTDAGLSVKDVDGLFTASAYYPMAALNVAANLGIRPRYSDGTAVGGSSFVAHLEHAATAIEAGLCDVALICYGSTQWSDGGKLVSISEKSPFEEPYGLRVPINAYGLAAARHMHEYGTTREDLAEVAVAARKWAQLNPEAFVRDDLTVAEALESRMISWPLSKADCCLVTDGGAAVLLTSADRARDLRQPGVKVLGTGSAHWHRYMSEMTSFATTSAIESGPRAFTAAGLTPADVDLAMLYDAFTINTLLFLEDLGFCGKGEGKDFVADGGIAPGGRLPVNTNGGGLSFGHPGMYGMYLITEAVTQLRGQAGERQVEDCEVALVHGNGGTLSHQSTALLGR